MNEKKKFFACAVLFFLFDARPRESFNAHNPLVSYTGLRIHTLTQIGSLGTQLPLVNRYLGKECDKALGLLSFVPPKIVPC